MAIEEAPEGVLRAAVRVFFLLLEHGGDLFLWAFRWTGLLTQRELSLGAYPSSPPTEGEEVTCTVAGGVELLLIGVAMAAYL